MMSYSAEKKDQHLAQELRNESEADAGVTPMDAVAAAARAGTLTDDRYFRLFARLWTLKRLMYYVYGGWAQGINLNKYRPRRVLALLSRTGGFAGVLLTA
jgi:hypothetical protein